MKRIIIAGTHSNAGKTTISIALMRALKNSGLDIAPFKVGPDYIDPKFHKFATGNPSYNLDSWMLDEDTVKYLFLKNCAGKDIAVIEGVMGLFDGIDSGTTGSTAHVSGILGAPVVLVADVRSMAASAAAMINGYKNYDKNLNLKGVILNRVSGKNHYTLLKTIIERDTGIKCLGYFTEDKSIGLESRHLGLIPVEELSGFENKIEALAQNAKETIDLSALIEMAEMESSVLNSTFRLKKESSGKLRIAIAMDEAFNFYYEDNLSLMKETGIELVPFSPVHDEYVPQDINGLYLGGGFPEVFAEKLAANRTMLGDIRNKLENGMSAYAECGGLMYLTAGISGIHSGFFPAVGFFKCKTKMTNKLQRFGYCVVNYNGLKIRAHEFHHTTIEEMADDELKYEYKVEKPGKNTGWDCGLSKKNVLAGYAHIHFYANIDFFKKIISLFLSGKKFKKVMISDPQNFEERKKYV